MLAPSVIWGVSREGLAELARYAKAQNMCLTMHLLETADDDEFSLANYGRRTVPLLEETGILENNFLAVHAIQLEKEDIELFKRYQTKVSYNPVANMILGSGVAPIPKFAQEGIQMSLGTDGAASNDSQNLIEVMKSGVLLQKVQQRDPTALSAGKVFSMATSEGAATVNMADLIGSLVSGQRADILVVDLDLPNTTPSYNPITSLVYSGNEQNIRAVFVEGQLLLENDVFTRVDEAALIHKTQEQANAMYKAAFKV
jgi:5-methylthioadenosine/S-adenosylhomocysteine deaminase